MSSLHNKDVESIYPLTSTQELILSHSLIAHDDESFLQIKCWLTGSMDISHFKHSWGKVLERHEALRSSVHWEKISRPVRVVQKNVPINIVFESLGNGAKIEERVAELLVSDANNKVDLRQVPNFRLHLIKHEEDRFFMLWTCHHLLLDGWSAGVILSDLLDIYNGREELTPISPYKEYKAWVDRQKADDLSPFWSTHLSGVAPNRVGGTHKNEFDFRDIEFEKTKTEKLDAVIKKFGITTSLFYQAIWALLLARVKNSNSVTLGVILSGRSVPDIPSINQMTGMFTTTLPFVVKIDRDLGLSEWLMQLFKIHKDITKSEYLSITEIMELAKVETDLSIIDCLFIYENFPLPNKFEGKLNLVDYSSGLTSVYPLTLAILPGQETKLTLKYNVHLVSEKAVDWLINSFGHLCDQIRDTWDKDISTLMDSIEAPLNLDLFINNEVSIDKKLTAGGYEAPKNSIELELVKIWEKVLGVSSISINDNFFSLGGNSLKALKLFSELKSRMNTDISPSVLLQRPNVRQLSELIVSDNQAQSWSCIVPLKTTGNKPPLFFVHAGGAHVLFYKSLIDQITDDQPIYAIQPKGLNGQEPYHESVEEMASCYWDEIKKIYPSQKIGLLGYCHSNPVCIEMAKLIKNEQRELSILAIVDAPPNFYKAPDTTKQIRRLLNSLGTFDYARISNAIGWRIRRKLWKTKQYLNESRDNKRLLDTENALRKTYSRYQWREYEGSLTIFQSIEYRDIPEKQIHIDLWKELIKGDVTVVNIPGKHHNIFEEPAVMYLAQELLARTHE